jgi:hypothetical protein
MQVNGRTDRENELMVELFGYDPQQDSETQSRHPEPHDVPTSEEELEGLQSVLKAALFIHSRGHLETTSSHVGQLRHLFGGQSYTYPVSIRNHPYSAMRSCDMLG